jgi:hypothetical protein
MFFFTRALLVAAVWGGAACSVYDSSGLTYSNGGMNMDMDSSVAPGDACTPGQEVCNRKDDDCDGTVDEAEAVALDCASQVLHSGSTCQTGYCVKIGECEAGYYNCDGMPNNGCESTCPCGTDCDDDAGIP